METYDRIYKLMVNLYPGVFPRQPEETVWMVANSIDEAMTKLRKEYPRVTVSGISPIFGCVLTTDSFDYCDEVYEVDLSLKNGVDTIIHVLASNISEVVDFYMDVYNDVIKAEITTLAGTVVPMK